MQAIDHLGMPRHPINRALTVLFVTVVAAPLVVTVLTIGRRGADDPKQGLAPYPARPTSLKDAGAWPTRFRRWFADHYAGRRELIRAHGALMLRTFGVSPSLTVLLGRDG